MKRQGNMTPQKLNNHTTKDLNGSKEDEISISRLKRMIKSMINEMKEDIHEQLSEIKENMNK
jgi:hypothetical protein